MKTLKHGVVVVLLCSLAACASDPGNNPESVHTQCRLELNAARTAVHLRDQGKSKQDMLATLPPLGKKSSRLLHHLYAIINESYAYPRLNDVVYGIYRYDRCARGLRGQALPDLKTIYPRLLDCQSRYGRQPDKQAVACVRQSYTTLMQTPASTAGPIKHETHTGNTAAEAPSQ